MKNQRGFSLVNVLVAVGILSITTLGFLEIVRSVNSLAAQTEVRNEIVDQLFVLRVVLQDSKVCTANMAGLNITTGTVSVAGLSPLDDKGFLKKSESLLPLKISTSETRAYATKLWLVREGSNLVKLNVMFSSRMKLAGLSDFVRGIPIYAEIDSAGIVNRCTTSPNGLIADGTSTATPPSPTAGGLGKGCDSAPAESSTGLAVPASVIQARQDTINRICSTLTFPSKPGATAPNSALGAFYSTGRFAFTHDYLATQIIIPSPGAPIRLGPIFHNLKSIEDCRAISAIPAGSVVGGSLPGASTGSVTLTCLGGQWIPTGFTANSVGANDGGGGDF